MAPRVFLSHAPSEKNEIQQLRHALEDRGVAPIGDHSADTHAAIHAADAFVLLLSRESIGSDLVKREVQWALERAMTAPAYRLVVFLRDLGIGTVPLLFGAAQPVCFPVSDGLWITQAAIKIRETLGEATGGISAITATRAPPMAELTLEFFQPKLLTVDGKSRLSGMLRLKYTPAEGGRGVDGTLIEFVSPLGPREAEDLRWYIEDYFRWPFDVFRERAKGIEAELPQWGKLLYDAIVRDQEKPMCTFIDARRDDGTQVERRITINVDDRKADTEGKDAAALLFGLPWELLHDGASYLFDGVVKARVRRTLPSDVERRAVKPRERVRVLLVRARPEDESAAFLDPRATAMPLVETLHELGDQVKLDILPDGTFEAMQDALRDAEEANDPYQVVHFDGHGIYDKVRGLGLLCFEDAEDARNGLEKRRSDPVKASKIGGLLRDRRVPLFVLDACQTATADKQPETSVAAELLRQGVVSVVAMRYSVLIPTATKFAHAFYGALANGKRIGTAMVEAQLALKHAPVRLDFGAKGRLSLEDWMVPVLFQEGDDPQIFIAGVDTRPAAIEDRKKVDMVCRGDLPQLPGHGFVGRAKDLLRIERRIRHTRRVAILGRGGEGKTALAAEAARWFLLTKQRERVAFVSVERLSDARAVLDAIGRQLVAGYSVATAEAGGGDPIVPVKNALLQRQTLLMIDNFESLIAFAGKDPTNEEAVREIVNLVHELTDAGETWLITTSREALPAPLEGNELRLGSLGSRDARELLVSVLRDNGIEPAHEGKSAEEMEKVLATLIEAVGGHARSLVLLGPNIAMKGIEATRDAIRQEMVAMEKQFPEDRERSLLASVRISLSRLDGTTRKKIAPLCVFRRAAPVQVMAHVLAIEPNNAVVMGDQLIVLGLASAEGSYLLPDPALGETLGPEMDPIARGVAEERWREGMQQFAEVLYRQQFHDAYTAVRGTTITLIDLLYALEATVREVEAGTISADRAVNFAAATESLVSIIGQPRALERARVVRQRLSKMLPAWNHARFRAESEDVDRLIEAGNIDAALYEAERLRDQAENVGDAYPEAAYDRAIAWLRLGRSLSRAGADEQALGVLEEAHKRFAAFAEMGNAEPAADGVVIVFIGDALSAMGKLDAAATKYEEAIRQGEARGAMRQVAVARGRLGTVRSLQERFRDAVDAWQQTRRDYETLSEPANVATAWHEIGSVQHAAGDFPAAEQAYKEALRIRVSLGNRWGEAATLGQLGNLYAQQRQLEPAVTLYRQAMTLCEELGDTAGLVELQLNLGITLHKLGRLDEARKVLKPATAATMQRGWAGKPWKIWNALRDVEREAGNLQAAAEARAQNMMTYRAYRLAGGGTIHGPAQLVVDVGNLVANQEKAGAARALMHEVHTANATNAQPEAHALIIALDAIVVGKRDPKLAEDPALDPYDAVELQILLESLIAAGK